MRLIDPCYPTRTQQFSILLPHYTQIGPRRHTIRHGRRGSSRPVDSASFGTEMSWDCTLPIGQLLQNPSNPRRFSHVETWRSVSDPEVNKLMAIAAESDRNGMA